MYSGIIRDDAYKFRLREFIQNEYGIDAVDIVEAKRGFFGETWKVCSGDARYFVKLVYCDGYMSIYERSLPIVRHLCDHGIDFAGRIVKAKHGRVSSRFDGAAVGVFDWIDGVNTQTNATKILEYQMMAKVYAVSHNGLDIPIEDFSSRYADEFLARRRTSDDGLILSMLEINREKLEHRAGRLSLFAELCRDDMSGFVITHGDVGGNFVVSGNRNYIVDWDGVALAPPERDGWVMCGYDWARDAFDKALRDAGINYKLRPERLAYYCYQFFFYYLNSFIDARSDVAVIVDYVDNWISESFRWADGI